MYERYSSSSMYRSNRLYRETFQTPNISILLVYNPITHSCQHALMVSYFYFTAVQLLYRATTAVASTSTLLLYHTYYYSQEHTIEYYSQRHSQHYFEVYIYTTALSWASKSTFIGTSDRGTARFASTLRLSTTCCFTDSAASTLAEFMYVMKPKPRDRRDTASFITIASATGPNCSKYRLRASSVVSKERPPMKILLQCLFINEYGHV